jgi:hypothetical protein
MTYFTTWDVNAFLCLVYWGLPDDVVKRMMNMMKKTHEGFSLGKALSYWVSNSPSIVRVNGTLKFIHGWGIRNEWESRFRKNIWQNRRDNIIEFKREWRLRSIEGRKEKVVQWCLHGDNYEQHRHQDRLSNCWVRDGFGGKREKNPELKDERRNYTKNLWRSWEAGASSYYFVGQNRRNYVAKWYEGIHPGRFFLFYKKNKYIEERNKGLPKGPCEDGYRYPETPIYDWGPYEQLVEDLRCIDGPGLGEWGSKVEHIDDLFS